MRALITLAVIITGALFGATISASLTVGTSSVTVTSYAPAEHIADPVALTTVRQDINEARRCMALGFISGAVSVGITDEDWSYSDAPFVVSEWNDALMDEYQAQSDAGIQDPTVWLVTSTNDCMVAAYGNEG